MTSKILLVDDDSAILEALSAVVEISGYQPITTTHAAQVVPLVKIHSPSLIILDVMLPDGDGRKISLSLKTDPRFKKIPIILISAHIHSPEILTESLAEKFLAKPLDINNLLATVQSLII